MLSIDALKQVTIAITRKCNLTCEWCFMNADMRHEDVLDTDALIGILESLANKVTGVTLTGGEPFIREDIGILIQKALDLEFKEVSITTNGLAIHPKYEKLLHNPRIALAVSIDGDAATHDSIRGSGTFKRTTTRIKELIDSGILVALFMTVSKRNLDTVSNLHALARELGVIGISYQRLRCIGRGGQYLQESLDGADMRSLASYIQSKQDPTATFFTNFKDPMRNLLNKRFASLYGHIPQNYICGGCQAGMSYLYITDTGDVQPCAFFGNPIGNILHDDLTDLWENSVVLNDLRRKERYKACNSCSFWNMCRGCRADAYNMTGDYLEGDPSCWICQERQSLPQNKGAHHEDVITLV